MTIVLRASEKTRVLIAKIEALRDLDVETVDKQRRALDLLRRKLTGQEDRERNPSPPPWYNRPWFDHP